MPIKNSYYYEIELDEEIQEKIERSQDIKNNIQEKKAVSTAPVRLAIFNILSRQRRDN